MRLSYTTPYPYNLGGGGGGGGLNGFVEQFNATFRAALIQSIVFVVNHLQHNSDKTKSYLTTDSPVSFVIIKSFSESQQSMVLISHRFPSPNQTIFSPLSLTGLVRHL